MFQKPKSIFIIITVMAMMLTGCGKGADGGDSARTAEEPSQMPDLVFLNCVDYSETAEEGETQNAINFYDKNGNHYMSTDPYVCSLYTDELVKEYAQGNLDDKIELHNTCDVDELLENYQKLCELSENKELEIIYPEYRPDVQADKLTWYGIYYDKDGTIQSILLHAKDAGGDHEANDERANEIYEWFIGACAE